MNDIKYAIEGILFAAGEPVKASKLAVVLDVSLDDIKNAVESLKEEYNRDKRGFAIIDILEGYQICSRPEYYSYIQEILGEQRNQPLSNAAMEALAIIAYKQPITRAQIERIRGVNSDGCVNRLYERGLIDECGRLDAPGRPILYKTTDTFLRCFGLRSPEELPPINFVQMQLEEEPQGEQQSFEDGIDEDVKKEGIPEADAAPKNEKAEEKDKEKSDTETE